MSHAADLIDALLGADPYRHSSPRTPPSHVLWVPPLAVAFDVSEDDRLVTVWAVWRR